jgi:hypothetical protein
MVKKNVTAARQTFLLPQGAYNEAVLGCMHNCYAVAVTSRKGDVRLR